MTFFFLLRWYITIHGVVTSDTLNYFSKEQGNHAPFNVSETTTWCFPRSLFEGTESTNNVSLIIIMSLYAVTRDTSLPQVLITRKAKTERGRGEEC